MVSKTDIMNLEEMVWLSFQDIPNNSSASVSKLQLLAQELKSADLKYQMQTAGSLEYIETGFSGDNTTVKIRAIALGNNDEFKILSAELAKFPQPKLDAGYKLENELNDKYKYVKFTIDKDGDLAVQWDLPDNVPNEAVGRTGVEILLRMFKIIDDAYPEIMKTIWS